MSKTKQTPSRRCAVPSGWPGLVFILGEGFFRTAGYASFIISGAVAAHKTGIGWFFAFCLLGHVSICFAQVIDKMSDEKPDSDDSANGQGVTRAPITNQLSTPIT